MNGWVFMGLVFGGIYYAIKAVVQITAGLFLLVSEFICWVFNIKD